MQINELELTHGSVTARVAPSRGAIVTSLTVGATPLLYMDRSTLEDPSRSVRGGIPILFPFAGRLANDRLVHAGSTMKQHGFGRTRAWHTVEQRKDFLRLGIESDGATLEVYPHAFAAEQGFTVLPRGLEITLWMHNRGETPMPVSPGWHPYFPCPSASKPGVQPLNVPALDPARFTTDAEFDFGVTAPVEGRADFEVPGLGRLRVSYSPEMRFLQCWGLPGRDYICLEPFLGPNNTINTPARLDVAPGRSHTLWMRVELS